MIIEILNWVVCLAIMIACIFGIVKGIIATKTYIDIKNPNNANFTGRRRKMSIPAAFGISIFLTATFLFFAIMLIGRVLLFIV